MPGPAFAWSISSDTRKCRVIVRARSGVIGDTGSPAGGVTESRSAMRGSASSTGNEVPRR